VSPHSLSDSNAELYDEISTLDISHPIQSGDALESKACADAEIIISALPPGDIALKVLEIGPGLGHLGRVLQKKFDYYAADLVGNYLKELNLKRGRSFLWDISIGGIHSKFDAIVACDVFEHVLNEGDAWLSAHDALKPGGILYLRVPYKEPLINYSRLLGAPYPYVHLRSYSLDYLREMSRYSGFKLLKVKKTYNQHVPHSHRGFGIRSKILRAESHIQQLRSGYSVCSPSQVPQESASSDLTTRAMYGTLKRIFDLLGPRLQSISRLAYKQIGAWTAPIRYRPAEIALVLEKKPNR
jgi:SAM-dependent methyltransferase